MPIASFGAAIPSAMDTDRMIPTASQNGSPGSQESGGSAQMQHQQGLLHSQYQQPPPLPPQQHFISPTGSSIPRKKKTERLVPPILNPNSLMEDLNGGMASYANHPSAYMNGSRHYDGPSAGSTTTPTGILVNSGHTNHGFSQDSR